jgi:hypothetical protein
MILGSLQYLKKSGNYRIKNYSSNSHEFITPNYNEYNRIISYKFRNINFSNFVEIRSFINNINKIKI